MDRVDLAASLAPGSRFESRYEILEELGSGAFGRVYRARQLSTGQTIAIKILSPREGAAPPSDREVERFRRETRICADLSHPNIVQLIDSGETSDGQLYAVFAYIPGETLEQALEREGTISVREAVRLMTQVLEALESAHGKGIVHRDLKPANLMLTGSAPRRAAVVLDFGLGALAEDRRREEWQRLTQTQEFLGTPLYASPEQLAGEPATARSDLYAWGLVLLECLTGRHPFAEKGAAARLLAGGGEVELPAWLADHRLGELLATVTAADPRRREATAEALIESLEEIAGGELPCAPNTLPESGRRAERRRSGPRSERRLAAIVSADVVGYSRLMADDEDATVRTVQAYREEIELHVRQYRGRMEFTGDNFLAEFSSAVEAVRCGMDVQRVLQARNAHLPAERRMEFRMGIHLGDVRVEGERLFGTGVNTAARLEGLAKPGGICISETVREQLRGRLRLEFEDLGERRVKNIPEPVHCYRVQMDASSSAAAVGSTPQPLGRPRAVLRRWAAGAGALILLLGAAAAIRECLVPPPLTPIRSLAVLPLENLSGDPEQEYFADGMTEALIGELAKLGALSVISRTSVMKYKRERKPLPEIADELGVEGIIEGTVMRAGDRVRITAQLIDARTDHHIWNERFDRNLSDVLVLQADVARAVAEQVRLELTPQEHAGLTSRTVDPRALDAYFRGKALVGPWGEVRGWGPDALAQLERAVELDPGLAEAWAWIANVRMLLGAQGFYLRNREQYPKAREAAQRAIDLGDNMGMAHAVLAYILMQNSWDFAAAEREFRRAMELSPGDPTVVNGLAWYLLLTGKTQQGLALSERLPRIAPGDLFFRADHFRELRFGRQYDRALEEVARIREVEPTFSDPIISHLYFNMGRLEEAQRALIAYYDSCGERCDPRRQAALRGWAEGGWAGSMRAVAELYASIEDFSPNVIAMYFSLAGDTDEAFAWLEKGYRQREPLMINVKGNPSFDPIRADPRFEDLVRRIGFPADSDSAANGEGAAAASSDAGFWSQPAIAVLPFDNLSGNPDQD